MSRSHDVVVIGSINHDITVVTPRLPRPGETLIADRHVTGPGGKGANQAVAAARLGASVAMIGMVGDDAEGRDLLSLLADEGVDTTGVGVISEARTGLALITVDVDGENTIVGSSGANMRLTPEDVKRHRDLIADAAVVIAQLEVPVESVEAAAGLTEGVFCLNPAPARPLPSELVGMVDVLVPNRTELGLLADMPEPVSQSDVVAALGRLGHGGSTVVTLGADGALLASAGEVRVFSPHPVEVVDTTGAGDAFCGALAVELSRRDDVASAVAVAVVAGALAVTRLGAQSALPTRADLDAALGR